MLAYGKQAPVCVGFLKTISSENLNLSCKSCESTLELLMVVVVDVFGHVWHWAAVSSADMHAKE